MRTVRAGLVMAAVVALGLVPGPCDAHAPGARREGAISCEELRRQLTTQGGGIFSDAAATRGDRGAHWGSAYASTYIVAGVVYQTTSVRTGILYVYEPTSGQYRAAALFNNYDANRPLTGEEAAVYGRATRHLYPASGDAPQPGGGSEGQRQVADAEQSLELGLRLGQSIARFCRAAGGAGAVVLVLLATAVLVWAVAAALVAVVPVLSSALARHRAISQAGEVLRRHSSRGSL